MALLVALLYYIERGQMRYALLCRGGRGFRDVGKGEYADRPFDLRGVLPLPGLDAEGAAAGPLGQGRRARGARRGRDHGGLLFVVWRAP